MSDKQRAAYSFAVDAALGFEEAEAKTRELLKEEGFGVLTEIDVAATLEQKLGVQFRPYKILGACNPQLAHRALEVEPLIGVLLPCNVVVEATGQRAVRVAFMDPEAALGMVGNPAVADVAQEAAVRLHRVADRLSSAGASKSALRHPAT